MRRRTGGSCCLQQRGSNPWCRTDARFDQPTHSDRNRRGPGHDDQSGATVYLGSDECPGARPGLAD